MGCVLVPGKRFPGRRILLNRCRSRSTKPAVSQRVRWLYASYMQIVHNLRQTSRSFFADRIQLMAVLIVLCFVSVLLLESQSRSSYPTYLLAILMLAFTPRWVDVFRLPLMMWITALLAWLSLSTFWSEPFDLRAAASNWVRALLILTFVVAMAECQLRGQLQRWMSIGLTLTGVLAVGAAVANFYLTNPADGRLNGLGQLDTHVIAALVYGVVLIFVLRAATTSSHKLVVLFSFCAALLIAYAVYLSDSRNAWVSVVIGVGSYLLAKRTHDVRQFVAAMAALAAVLTVSLLILLLSDTTRELLLPRGTSFRLDIWSTTWENITVNGGVLFGLGIATEDDLVIEGLLFSHPHNLYLALVHQGGLIALALYLGVLWKSFAVFARKFETEDAKLGLSLLVMAVSAHLLDGHELLDKVGDTWFLVWMPVGLALGLCWTPGDKEETFV